MAEYLKVQQVAQRWACSAETVRRLCKSGALPSFALVGDTRRISLAAVEAYEAERSTAQPVSQPAPRARQPQAAAGGAVLDINAWRASVHEAAGLQPAGRGGSARTKKRRPAVN